MASIQCTNCGAVLKTPDVIAPGKKVKCPKCAEMFVVATSEEAPDDDGGQAVTAKPKKSAMAAADDEQGVAEGTPPPKKQGRRDRDDDDGPDRSVKKPAKSSNMLLFLLLGGGFLLLMCCIATPIGAFLFLVVPAADKMAVEVNNVQAEMKNQIAVQDPNQAIVNAEPDLAKKDVPANPMAVSAEQLTQEIDNDRANFQKKYAGQELIVKGIVAKVSKLDKISTTVQMQTPSKIRLLANFIPPDRITAKKGQTIEFSTRFQNFSINGDDLRVSAKLINQN